MSFISQPLGGLLLHAVDVDAEGDAGEHRLAVARGVAQEVLAARVERRLGQPAEHGVDLSGDLFGSSPVLTIMSPREMSISSSRRIVTDCSATVALVATRRESGCP
jgi:hypothetical protein